MNRSCGFLRLLLVADLPLIADLNPALFHRLRRSRFCDRGHELYLELQRSHFSFQRFDLEQGRFVLLPHVVHSLSLPRKKSRLT